MARIYLSKPTYWAIHSFVLVYFLNGGSAIFADNGVISRLLSAIAFATVLNVVRQLSKTDCEARASTVEESLFLLSGSDKGGCEQRTRQGGPHHQGYEHHQEQYLPRQTQSQALRQHQSCRHHHHQHQHHHHHHHHHHQKTMITPKRPTGRTIVESTIDTSSTIDSTTRMLSPDLSYCPSSSSSQRGGGGKGDGLQKWSCDRAVSAITEPSTECHLPLAFAENPLQLPLSGSLAVNDDKLVEGDHLLKEFGVSMGSKLHEADPMPATTRPSLQPVMTYSFMVTRPMVLPRMTWSLIALHIALTLKLLWERGIGGSAMCAPAVILIGVCNAQTIIRSHSGLDCSSSFVIGLSFWMLLSAIFSTWRPSMLWVVSGALMAPLLLVAVAYTVTLSCCILQPDLSLVDRMMVKRKTPMTVGVHISFDEDAKDYVKN